MTTSIPPATSLADEGGVVVDGAGGDWTGVVGDEVVVLGSGPIHEFARNTSQYPLKSSSDPTKDSDEGAINDAKSADSNSFAGSVLDALNVLKVMHLRGSGSK